MSLWKWHKLTTLYGSAKRGELGGKASSPCWISWFRLSLSFIRSTFRSSRFMLLQKKHNFLITEGNEEGGRQAQWAPVPVLPNERAQLRTRCWLQLLTTEEMFLSSLKNLAFRTAVTHNLQLPSVPNWESLCRKNKSKISTKSSGK